ncbi:uncharacterized protein LOC115646180 [Gopherus evgoodei]|uniref:uncharacterized protein LOC115646180 n=1 Tax=Gopherus evgoodei TaxID=1825980 RepID=UPI0011CF1076|nr:uncharacterized protein LOC115646180 [Gopherus evgoodei]
MRADGIKGGNGRRGEKSPPPAAANSHFRSPRCWKKPKGLNPVFKKHFLVTLVHLREETPWNYLAQGSTCGQEEHHLIPDLRLGTALDPPVIKIGEDLDPMTSEVGQYHRHELCEYPGSSGQAKWEDHKLVVLLPNFEMEEASVSLEYTDVVVRVLQMEGDVPVPGIQEGDDRGQRDHAELELYLVLVQASQVQDGPEPPFGLRDKELAGVVPLAFELHWHHFHRC